MARHASTTLSTGEQSRMACHEQAKRVEWAVLDLNQWLLPCEVNFTQMRNALIFAHLPAFAESHGFQPVDECGEGYLAIVPIAKRIGTTADVLRRVSPKMEVPWTLVRGAPHTIQRLMQPIKIRQFR